jgi:hypothetical protein
VPKEKEVERDVLQLNLRKSFRIGNTVCIGLSGCLSKTCVHPKPQKVT